MDVIVDSSIAQVAHIRVIPGSDYEPYKGTATKESKEILNRFVEGRPMDLRRLILIADLKFYFETILISVIDWVSRDPLPTYKLSRNERKFINMLKEAKGKRILKQPLADALNLHHKTIEKFARTLPPHGYEIKNDREELGIPGYYLANWSTVET